MKERLRLICGSLKLRHGPLRTAADLYLPRIVSFTPASRLPAALHQSALCATPGLTHRSKTSAVARLFDLLVGAVKSVGGAVEAERLRHDQVNGEAELGRLLDRKIGGLRPQQNLVD